MKVYLNLPTTDEGKKQLNEAMADLQATLVIKTIEKLNLSEEKKKEILLAIIDELEKREQKEISSN